MNRSVDWLSVTPKLQNSAERLPGSIEQLFGGDLEAKTIWADPGPRRNLPDVKAAQDDSVGAVAYEEVLNQVPNLQDVFLLVHGKLRENGVFLGCMETVEERKARLYYPLPVIIGFPFHLADFFTHRVLSKVPWVRNVYFKFSGNRIKVMSKAELLGRLVAAGFSILSTRVKDGLFVFAAGKSTPPKIQLARTGAVLLRLKRVGQNGRIIEVCKLRTMARFSEYLQDYLYHSQSLEKGGKFKNDFRVTRWGRLFRKTWIDELPMIYNWFKGDVKLLGVRPLSLHYFSLYNEELKQKRIQLKPGLIPPYYADLPKSLEEIQESENRYIDSYLAHPWRTQWRYFWRVVWNIVFKGARSS